MVFDGNVDNGNNKPAYLRIAGSYNIIEHVIARNNDDTGISISAKDKNRFFWPAHNLVLNSDSYNNLDLSGINADGFAAKLGVGPGNIFEDALHIIMQMMVGTYLTKLKMVQMHLLLLRIL